MKKAPPSPGAPSFYSRMDQLVQVAFSETPENAA